MSKENKNLPGVRRLLREAKELSKGGFEYQASPLENNIFEWHFTIRGPPNTSFEGGIYHGRILFPNEYPMKPPSIIFLTPNGRFEVDKKICLSVSAYHPEEWHPVWGVRTILLAMIGFFPTPAEGAIGGTELSDKERRRLALLSQNWACPICQTPNNEIMFQEPSKTEQVQTNPPEKLPIFFRPEQPKEEKTDSKKEPETPAPPIRTKVAPTQKENVDTNYSPWGHQGVVLNKNMIYTAMGGDPPLWKLVTEHPSIPLKMYDWYSEDLLLKMNKKGEQNTTEEAVLNDGQIRLFFDTITREELLRRSKSVKYHLLNIFSLLGITLVVLILFFSILKPFGIDILAPK